MGIQDMVEQDMEDRDTEDHDMEGQDVISRLPNIMQHFAHTEPNTAHVQQHSPLQQYQEPLQSQAPSPLTP